MATDYPRTEHGRQSLHRHIAMLDGAADALPTDYDPLGHAWNMQFKPTERFFWLRAAHLHQSHAELSWGDLAPATRQKLRETVKRIASRAKLAMES